MLGLKSRCKRLRSDYMLLFRLLTFDWFRLITCLGGQVCETPYNYRSASRLNFAINLHRVQNSFVSQVNAWIKSRVLPDLPPITQQRCISLLFTCRIATYITREASRIFPDYYTLSTLALLLFDDSNSLTLVIFTSWSRLLFVSFVCALATSHYYLAVSCEFFQICVTLRLLINPLVLPSLLLFCSVSLTAG